VLVGLAGCTAATGTGEFNDPYEAQNRVVHEANRDLDRGIVGPSASAYGSVVPKPVQQGIDNFSGNLGTPGQMVNNLLQGDVEHLVENSFRLVINTTIGIGGIFDPAKSIGMAGRDTDFGETLYVWGVDEGAYLELPVLGPSTERDAAGKVADFVLDPLRYVLPSPEKYVGTVAGIASKIGDRDRYSEVVESILYGSADSYAQARLLYLQNRRFELGDEAQTEYFDPYEDINGQ